MAKIELAELVEGLRRELSPAREPGQSEEWRLEVGRVELELTVVVTKEGGASDKMKFWVVEPGVSGDTTTASGATQRLKLMLTRQFAGDFYGPPPGGPSAFPGLPGDDDIPPQ
jgi:hypothetical protein